MILSELAQRQEKLSREEHEFVVRLHRLLHARARVYVHTRACVH